MANAIVILMAVLTAVIVIMLMVGIVMEIATNGYVGYDEIVSVGYSDK